MERLDESRTGVPPVTKRIAIGPPAKETGETPVLPSQETGETPVPPFLPFDPAAVTNIHERHLPHWKQEGAMYFITFRLWDSIPQAVLAEWLRVQEAWLRRHPEPRTPQEEQQYRRMFSEKMEKYLDTGYGSCLLANPAASEIVEKAFLHFDGQRYHLGAYVVMPNHAHLLVIPKAEFRLSGILHSWKSFTSHAVNKALKRTGTLWQDESYDHIVRSEAQRSHYEEYIRHNPVAAGLRPASFRLGCGSAGALESRTGVPPVTTPNTDVAPDEKTGGTPVLP